VSVKLEDLPPKERRRLKLRKPREVTFTKDEVRGNALKALGAIAHLTQKERRRVLLHALKLNDL
jgi:hypothetical protein